MFIGHAAVGLASKRVAPKVGLGWLVAAPLFLDLLWPIFLLLGIESVTIDPGNTVVTPLDLHDYPYTHSLATSLAWSVGFALVYYLVRKDQKGALILAAGVFSHWILDWITHRPDMPLYPGSETRVGLGLWNSLPGTLVVELAMFAGAVYLYARATRPRDRTGSIAWWAFVAFLLVSYVSAIFGPPPPDENIMAWVALTQWLLVAWAAWIDRHRAAS
jgi:membrane-bound metal-dependent hydrolase YbcI (DUF457 family)